MVLLVFSSINVQLICLNLLEFVVNFGDDSVYEAPNPLI